MLTFLFVTCRWDVSLKHNERTLSTIKKCAQLPSSKPLSERLGVKDVPLLNLELHDVVVDVLHLMLRVMDVLIRNLVYKMAELDLATRRQRGNREHMDHFVSVVRSQGIHVSMIEVSGFIIKFFCLGVSFSVWEARDCTGRVQKGIYDWTSLGGTDLLKLLHQLPPLFSTFLPTSIVHPVTQLWQVLHDKISVNNYAFNCGTWR